MMSTLPRLPAKYRGYSNNTGLALPNAIRTNKASYFQPTPQNVTQTSPKSPTFSPKTSDNYQLQSIRDEALKKYEAYNWQLRQLERNFQLDVKRFEQQGTRDISRVMDSISALKSEMTQLTNQANILQTKLNNLKSKQMSAETAGVQTLIDPLKNGFEAFGKEFDGALKNINILFSNLSSRVQTVQRSFDAYQSSNSEALNISDSLKELESNLKNNSIALLSVHNELESMLNRHKSNVETRIQNRISSFHDRIDALEQLSFQSLNKYQTVAGDAQISQYELRDLFDNSINTISSSFKLKLEESKRSIFELQQSRFDQIDAINARLSKTRESIAKMRKKKLKNIANNLSSSPLSHQSTIENLTKKVSELEQNIQEKIDNLNQQELQSESAKEVNPLMAQFQLMEQSLNQNEKDIRDEEINETKSNDNIENPQNNIDQNANDEIIKSTGDVAKKEIPEIRVYYNIDENENVKIIFADRNGYVVYN